MLEGALVLLPLMAIGLALLDFPLGIFIQNTLRNSVREGVRYAITQQTAAGGQDAAIRDVIKQNSVGFMTDADLNASPARSTIVIQYYDPVTLVEKTGTGCKSTIGLGPLRAVKAKIPFSPSSPCMGGRLSSKR